ncbi:MAG: rane protein [Acidobacteriota bacterium]|jgi:YihY family inner membrane protein|nr:rane protein [Acidobacteriota bacterium]MDT5063666.1 rane protein [Acidobacteriota bacterium]
MRRQPSFSRASFGVLNKAPWLKILGHSVHQFHENDLFTSAAAMSYFGLLTLFPGLILLLTLGKRLTAGTDMLNEMLRHVVQVYPGSGEFLDSTVRSLSDVGTGALITCFVVVLWAGSWVFAVVERALNRIWNTTSRAFLHGRALTLGMIGIVGLLLTVSVLFTSVLVGLQQLAGQLSPRQLERWSWLATFGSIFWQTIFVLVSILITVILFMLVYRFMPNARVRLRDTIPGAIIGGLLWEAAKYIFAWSLHYFHYDQIYGSVGAVVAVLTWGYVSSLILLFGAQLTAVFHREHPAEPVKPSAADASIAPMP